MADEHQAPPRQTKKTTLILPKDLHTRIKVLAVEEDREMGELVTEALEAYLRSKGRDRPAR